MAITITSRHRAGFGEIEFAITNTDVDNEQSVVVNTGPGDRRLIKIIDIGSSKVAGTLTTYTPTWSHVAAAAKAEDLLQFDPVTVATGTKDRPTLAAGVIVKLSDSRRLYFDADADTSDATNSISARLHFEVLG